MSMDVKARNSYDCGNQLLNNKTYLDQSVHCFYYSLIQLMKYKLANLHSNSISYEKQDEDSNGDSSHNWLINQIYLKFDSRKLGNNFQDVCINLKRLRKKADYGSEQITLDECLNSKDLRDKAVSYLGAIR